MRVWTRAANAETICGGPCNRIIRRGEPLLELRFVAFKTPLRRCAGCAGEPVPVDLPALEEQKPITPMVLLRSGTGALPFDFKAAQAGREPGDDDD